MANAIAGVGTTFERWSGSAWQFIAEINAIEGPTMNKENIEVTALDTDGGYDEFITGFMEGGTLTLNMNFTRSGYELMKQDFEIDVARDYRITLPDDEDTTLEFEGLVIEIPLTMEAEDKLTVDVTIQVTGEVALASESYFSTRTPTGLVLTVLSDTSVKVDWTDAAAAADGLKVYFNDVLKDTIAFGVGTTTVTGLTAGTAYTVKVVAYKGLYESDPITMIVETTTYESYISGDADLIAFYRMDEQSGAVFEDKTGNYDADIVGGITLGVENAFIKEPMPSDAVTFDGASGYAVIGDVAALRFARTDPFTVTAIIKPNTIRTGTTNTDYWIYTKANTSVPYQGLLIGVRWNYHVTEWNPAQCTVWVQFGANYPTQWMGFKSKQVDVQSGQNYLLTVTYDGSAVVAGLKAYLNGWELTNDMEPGVLSQTIAAGEDTTTSGIDAEIGRRTTLNGYFKGDLKDLAIFGTCKSGQWIRKLNVLAKCYDPIYSVTPTPKIFYDLDIDSDIDDVVDVLVALNLENAGELELIAAVVTATGVKAAACLYAILNYYGRTDLPIGVNTDAVGFENDLYNSAVVTAYGVTGKLTSTDFESYLITQRRELSAQSDASVEYITTGDLSSVKGLIDSTADGYSALSGIDLIKAKIKHLWIVGGNWPRGAAISDFGGTAPRAVISDYVLNNWPSEVPIIFIPINEGNSVEVGENVMEALNASNPAKLAWESYFGNSLPTNTRPGWSQIAFLAIARGLYNQQTTATKYAGIVGHKGTASINTTTGVTAWDPNVNGGHNYLWKIETDANFITKINELIKDATEW